MTVNIYNNYDKITANQKIYDAFNDFIISTDRNVFNKLIWRHNLYQFTKDVPGDIVECGVFKGSGMLTWLKLLNMYEPHSLKKVIGFDFFEPTFVNNLPDEKDKQAMRQVFDRLEVQSKNDLSKETIERKILTSGFHSSKFELVQGDISNTSLNYQIDRPGFRISLLYMDLDLAQPTLSTLNNLWNRISYGGVIVFDEYAHHLWSEADGVDEFFKDKGLETYLIPTNVGAPTHYMVKH